jgi:hypothetical protein
MKFTENQLLKYFSMCFMFSSMLIACQNNKNTTKDEPTLKKTETLTKKASTDTVEISEMWLLKDIDLEKGEVTRVYKVTELTKDSLKYVKSKIIIDTTKSNWQEEVSKQLSYDVNISYRVSKSVKDKWIESKKIIGIYKKIQN